MDNFYAQKGDMLQERMSAVFRKTYMFMALALVISGVCAYMVFASGSMIAIAHPYVFLIVELVILFLGTSAVKKRQVGLATLLFFLYSIVNGVTLSFIFYINDMGSIANVFFITAGTFVVLAIYGTVTKKNLSALGTVGLMALIGVIIITLLNVFFIKSQGLDLLLTVVGLALFIGITAYDVQKIKNLAIASNLSESQIAIFGAFELYLDFINIFLRLLSLFNGGGVRNRR